MYSQSLIVLMLFVATSDSYQRTIQMESPTRECLHQVFSLTVIYS